VFTDAELLPLIEGYSRGTATDREILDIIHIVLCKLQDVAYSPNAGHGVVLYQARSRPDSDWRNTSYDDYLTILERNPSAANVTVRRLYDQKLVTALKTQITDLENTLRTTNSRVLRLQRELADWKREYELVEKHRQTLLDRLRELRAQVGE
jgi:hypothetical protein